MSTSPRISSPPEHVVAPMGGDPQVATGRRRMLNAALADAVMRCYSGEADINIAYVVERASSAIEAAMCEQGRIEQWLYLRVVIGPEKPSRAVVEEIANTLRESEQPIRRWWWLNKWDPLGPAVRVRIQVPARFALQIESDLAASLERKGLDVTKLRYEPELRLFGGPHGIEIVHEIFSLDSDFLAQWARLSDRSEEPVLSPGLSLGLTIYLVRACGLDLFEQWDIFDRVAAKRPVPETNQQLSGRYRDLAARVVVAHGQSLFDLYGGELRELLASYTSGLSRCAERLIRAHYRGELECGLRDCLVPVILFHWNRVGLSSIAQARLAQAAADEFARLSRKGRD